MLPRDGTTWYDIRSAMPELESLRPVAVRAVRAEPPA
jgi:hypothetical protein